MKLVQFKSRFPSLVVPVPVAIQTNPDERVYFTNGLYKTDDQRLIDFMRKAAELESTGPRSFEETSETDSLLVSGIIHLELVGAPYAKILCKDSSLEWIQGEIKRAMEMPRSQVDNRIEQIAPISQPVASYSAPEFPDRSSQNVGTKKASPVKISAPKRVVRKKEKVS